MVPALDESTFKDACVVDRIREQMMMALAERLQVISPGNQRQSRRCLPRSVPRAAAASDAGRRGTAGWHWQRRSSRRTSIRDLPFCIIERQLREIEGAYRRTTATSRLNDEDIPSTGLFVRPHDNHFTSPFEQRDDLIPERMARQPDRHKPGSDPPGDGCHDEGQGSPR